MNKLVYKIKQIDLPLIFCYLLLVFSGLFIQLDITSASGTLPFFLKQFLITVISISFCLAIYLFWKIKWFQWTFWIFYLFTLFLLIWVLNHGETVLGATRVLIITIMGIRFSMQPSLIARLVLIILFARIISKREHLISKSGFLTFFVNFAPLLIFTCIYFYLIYKENHLSAILTSGFTLISLLFLANFRLAMIIMLAFCLILLGICVILWQDQGEFRQNRIKSTLNSSLIYRIITGKIDKSGIHPNNLESLICLTSGKLLGTSPDGGMGKLKYLPEPRTDFVFAIITEEFGLLGALFIIILYMGLVVRGINISSHQKKLFYKLIGYGFSLNIFFNIIIHIGTVTASMPTTGVTLPFISHGGSSMIVNSMAVGVLLILSRSEEITK